MATGADPDDEARAMTGRFLGSDESGHGASAYGSATIKIGAPGFYYDETPGVAPPPTAYLPTLTHGLNSGNYDAWDSDWVGKTGYTSGAMAVTAGVAGLALSTCGAIPSGEELANALLNGANTSPPVDISDVVEDGRYLSATGAMAEIECSF